MKQKNIPGIRLNTIPKSASIYLWGALSKGLGIPFMRVSGNWFPGDVVVPDQLRILVEGNAISQEHLPANPQNLVALNVLLDRFIVHVRDPRMTTLEWMHHLVTLKSSGDPEGWLPFLLPQQLPEGFFSMSMSEKIGAQIDLMLPVMIRWLEEWLDASEDSSFKPKILFTRYEDFVEDEEAFLAAILDFYEIDRSLFRFKPFRPKAGEGGTEGELHFRNARTDEWREVFTPEQLDKACQMMPRRLLKRFGWPLE